MHCWELYTFIMLAWSIWVMSMHGLSYEYLRESFRPGERLDTR